MSLFKNIAELHDLAADLSNFNHQLCQLAEHLKLNLTDFHCDHIAVRCHQFATAERWRKGLLQVAEVFSENMINGRLITLFDLTTPIQVAGLAINCLELPYPGKKFYPNESWQHIELVIPCAPELLQQTVLTYLSDQALLTPGIKLTSSQPVGIGQRLANPTFAISKDGITIKFHPYSIREIVAEEISAT